MKTTLEKAFEPKKERKIYRYHDYSTKHLVLVPLMFACWWLREFWEKKPRFETWSDKRTEKFLINLLIRFGSVDKEEQTISRSICKWQHYWNWYAKWYNKHYCDKYNKRITDYFLNTFEVDGYTKEIEEECEWITVTFRKIGVDK